MTVYTTLPTDDSNLEVELTESSNLVTLNINPAQVTGSGGALGTVTNVATGTGLTGGPITTTGTIAIDSTVATLSGSQALTNKTGLISQWTNDSSYLTSVPAQSFSSLTGKPTTVAGYGITDAFNGAYASLTGKPTLFSGAYADLSGKPSLFSGAYADLSGKPTIPTNNNQLTNGEGYTTNTGTVSSVGSGTGLTGGPITSSGTLNVDVGTSANQIVQLDSSAKLPAVDGSNLTNLPGGGGSGTVTSIIAGTGLSGGTITTTGTVAIDSTVATLTGAQALSNKTGLISQWTNDSGYTTATGDVTLTGTQTLTNKTLTSPVLGGTTTSASGNIVLDPATQIVEVKGGGSDSGAIVLNCYANTHGQTLKAQPHSENITNTMLLPKGANSTLVSEVSASALSNKTGNISQWTNDSNYSTTLTNANNRVITGSDTANTLNGESGLTYDGAKMEVEGSAAGVNDPVLHLKTDNSGWNRPQLMAEDSNGKVFSQVGQLNTGANTYQFNITLDPDNDQPRTNVGGNGNTYAGDYFVALEKNYNNTDNISMDMKVFGANNGFNLKVFDDNNGGVDSYGLKPFNVSAQEMTVDADGNRALDIVSDGIKFFDSYEFPNADGSANQVLTTDGAGNITFEDAGGLAASTTPTLTGGATAFQGLNYTVTVSNYNTAYVPNSQFRLEITKDSDSSVVSTPQDFTDNSDGTFSVTIPASATGAHTVRVKAQDFNKGSSAEATMSLTISAISFTKRYWRLKDFDGGGTGSAGNTSIQIMEFQLYSASSQGGTKYPTNMTSNTAPTPFVASGQGYYAPSGDTYNYFRAFDGNAANSFYWNLAGDMSTDYLAIDLGSAQTIQSFSFTSGTTASSAGKFALYYADSSDFSDEVLLQRFEFTTGTQTITFG